MNVSSRELCYEHVQSKWSICFVVQVGQTLRKATAGTGKKLSLELGGKSPVVVYNSADLDSTVEGVVNAIYFNQGQVEQNV